MFSGNSRGLSTRWFVALSRCGREAVEDAITEARENFAVSSIDLPESGVYLTPMDQELEPEGDSAAAEAMSGAAVLLTDRSTGEEYRGGAMVVPDDVELAETMAICDAVVRYRLAGWEKVATLAAEGTTIILDEERLKNSGGDGSRLDLPDLSGDAPSGDGEE